MHGRVANDRDAIMSASNETQVAPANLKSKHTMAKQAPQFDLIDAIHASEHSFYSKRNDTGERLRHMFEVRKPLYVHPEAG